MHASVVLPLLLRLVLVLVLVLRWAWQPSKVRRSRVLMAVERSRVLMAVERSRVLMAVERSRVLMAVKAGLGWMQARRRHLLRRRLLLRLHRRCRRV